MPRFEGNQNARVIVLAIVAMACAGLVALLSIQLALRIPDQATLLAAWSSLGFVLLILIALLGARRLAWVLGGAILAMGAEIFFLGIMARLHLWGHFIAGFLITALMIAITGAYKQTALRRE